ncbi:hypothetical protein OPQ81_011261 [Rhizoctonia solani]|nr:hypothetical protein OPQ81_011261 [Rhizoctonia solani]
MLLSTLFAVVLSPLVVLCQDIVYDTNHNITSLRGTWSTTNQFVLTPFMIANPINFTFNIPEQYSNASSASYSFTDDGFWEQCVYRLVSHGTSSCTKGVTIYQHGTYQLASDGSMTLTPFWQDGRIQILDPCMNALNQIALLNQTEHISSWRIFEGPKLRLFGEYYTPVEKMTRVYDVPQMLSTEVLSNLG